MQRGRHICVLVLVEGYGMLDPEHLRSGAIPLRPEILDMVEFVKSLPNADLCAAVVTGEPKPP